MSKFITDVTDATTQSEGFPRRLVTLGFRLMRVTDDRGHEMCRYIEPPMVTVPEGVFLMGNNKENGVGPDDEVPQHTVMLETFEIGQYPVTVAEYDLFIEATDRHEPPERNCLTWNNQRTQRHDHPVVNVLWEDARDYTQWLASLTEQPYCLPTEAQWEKAARGTDGRIYPWGNEPNQTNGNIATHATMPIGTYQHSMSPFGAHDMAGNVLEWTSSTFIRYPYSATDGRENLGTRAIIHGGGVFDRAIPKVMRGGSCDNTIWWARTTSRMPSTIPDWPGEHGFRLARYPGVAYGTIDPCPCGSGISFRICHGAALVQSSQDRRSEGTLVNLLGVSYYSAGDYAKAVEFHQRHLEISQELQDQEGEKAALANLVLAYDSLGDYDKVTEYCQRLNSVG